MTENCYEDLYASKARLPLHRNVRIRNVASKCIPEINEGDIVFSLKSLNNNKSPREDDILAEMIKETQELIVPKLKYLFDNY